MLPGYNFYENETNWVIPSHIVQVYQMQTPNHHKFFNQHQDISFPYQLQCIQ